jgi:hypothetical protein
MSQTFTAASARIAQIESVPGIFMESFSPAE